jgi:hypothetical protein
VVNADLQKGNQDIAKQPLLSIDLIRRLTQIAAGAVITLPVLWEMLVSHDLRLQRLQRQINKPRRQVPSADGAAPYIRHLQLWPDDVKAVPGASSRMPTICMLIARVHVGF